MQFVEILPKQKLPESEKNEQWYKDCVDQGLALINSYDSLRRSSRYNKKINYDLYSNVFHTEDLMYVLNPLGLEENTVPAELRHYDVITPVLNLLIGEESARIFNYLVRTINEDAISDKERELKEMLFSALTQRIQNNVAMKAGLMPPEQAQKFQEQKLDEEMAHIQRFMNYEYQDIRERVATHIIQYLRHRLDFDTIMQNGWEDALISGEEIYRVDITGGEPQLTRCNPLEVFYLLPHNSYYIDDADLIVEETWMSKGKILDEFYDLLTEEQLDQIEEGSAWSAVQSSLNYVNPVILHSSDVPIIDSVNQLNDYNSTIDSKGNIRVIRVTWKSRKKLGIVTYFNEFTGEQEELVVNETFVPSPEQQVEWVWVNEYREATKIGNNIYVKMQPCAVQRRHIDNLSICKSPYIGTIYNANNSRSCSMMDRLKTYQYLYNILFYRLELALAKSYGKIMEFDLAQLPVDQGFDMDKWLYYMQAMGISFKNSFQEGKNGMMAGSLGGASASTREINLEQGQFIQQHISLLSYIESKISEISGVSSQRRGEVGPKELVGNVQQSIMQSNYITEKYFVVHNNVKRRVLEALLEVAKKAWRGKKKRLQYVTDELGTMFLSFDGSEFDSAEYGLFFTNYIKDNQALDSMKQLMSIAMQADKISFSNMIDIMTTESIADVKKKIEKFEADAAQAAQAQAQAEQQLRAEELKQLKEIEARRDQLALYEIDANNETKIRVAEIQALSFDTETNETSTVDISKAAEIALKEKDLNSRSAAEAMGLIEKQNDRASKESIEREKIRLKQQEIQSKERIERLKADTAIRVAKENKTKAELSKSKKK